MNIINFCTLFDRNYIDRGIVLYNSLCDVEENFRLYVIAFDDECAAILKDLNYDKMVVIPYGEFEDNTLRIAKNNRTRRELIWTCSGYSIRYCIDRFNLDECTYLDADEFFYNSPRVLFEDFRKSGKDVAIIPHNFSKHRENAYFEKNNGKYCVEFNTFKNTDKGREVLDWWIEQCLEKCSSESGDKVFGDQKYLDEFEKKFDCIYVYDHKGAGVAPWNADMYKKSSQNGMISYNGEDIPLIFYHFHNMVVIDDNHIKCNVFLRPGIHDKKLIHGLYEEYGRRIDLIQEIIKRSNQFIDKETPQKESFWNVVIQEYKSEPRMIFFISKIWKKILFGRYDVVKI